MDEQRRERETQILLGAERIVSLLLAIPENIRRDVIAAAKDNGVICWECGIGSIEHPNGDCQCWNDE